MTAQNLPKNVAKLNKQSRFKVSNLLPRIAIYSTVLAGIIASFYDFKIDTLFFSSGAEFSLEAKQYTSSGAEFSLEAKQYISSINKAQQAYYAENGEFSNDITKLGLGIKEQTDNYNYTIASSIGPVQTLHNDREPARFESAIAIAKPNDMNTGKSYTGAVFVFKDKASNTIATIAAICASDRINASYAETWSPPTFDGQEIRCQPGTTMLYPPLKNSL
ncbi:MAG: type IV pilin-like G/H family protein [Oscillatoriaceae cyanobacterium Prado104]|jgi:hypothetical protein|nr:type IV pilin-like G/H family protein [Oscillatoriaceae cyanobacterium Prado104]